MSKKQIKKHRNKKLKFKSVDNTEKHKNDRKNKQNKISMLSFDIDEQ